ncbi:MAG: M28 family peptidase [Chloroflexota bacterium]
MNRKIRYILLILLFLVPWVAYSSIPEEGDMQTELNYGVVFDGERALSDLMFQVQLGPRTPASSGHAEIVMWLTSTLENIGWEVEIQRDTQMGHPIQNIVDRIGRGRPEKFLIGAHYDTRMVADQDPDPSKTNFPVPGANDGASGVAVLLELARVIPKNIDKEIWLVFFDAEDNGRLPGWDWVLGSKSFVENNNNDFDAAIVVDMVGDADLNIYYERSSDIEISKEIWQVAILNGYSSFIPTIKYHMIDDHTAFKLAGIPAVLIIDFDYPYWHTSEDNLSKVSAESLEQVGGTLLEWLLK